MTVLGCLGMMLSQQLGGKAMNNTALVFVGEAEELVACEVSGMGSSQVEKMSLLLVEAKISQPVELILMWVEARFGVHAVVDFRSVENHGLGDEGSCLPVPKAAEPRNTGPRNALPAKYGFNKTEYEWKAKPHLFFCVPNYESVIVG